MIVFDLKCGGGHVFEAWFGSSEDYEDQRGRGLVICPLCGDAQVGKAVMAPAVAAKGNQAPTDAPDPQTVKRMLAGMAEAQRKALEQSSWVGERFADEARAIEAGAFVVAAAQVGRHEDGRDTYGHSLVVNPWGRVLLDMGSEQGVGFADLDLGEVEAVRSRLPAIRHRRPIPSAELI